MLIRPGRAAIELATNVQGPFAAGPSQSWKYVGTPPALLAAAASETHLKPQPGTHTFIFRGTSTSALQSFAALFGISTVADEGLVARNVRIHLDAVENLGDFIEFEAVAASVSDLTRERGQALRLRQLFGVDAGEIIGGSYCDLISARTSGL